MRRRYGTDVEGAYEYALRKDCGDAWEAELNQRYAFWSEAECRQSAAGRGPARGPPDAWPTIRGSLHTASSGRLSLCDAATGAPLPVPAAKLVAVAERL